MNRAEALASLRGPAPWDIVVIGGGATGLGTALDAATRGYRTALVEARDFASGTSSRSTKLIHGGVRYLRSGNVGLVRRALRERTLLRKNAPGLVTELGFVIPAYAWHERWYYGAGLKIYDLLAGDAARSSRLLRPAETLVLAPTLQPRGLRGGVLYHDAQFDDARLAIAIATAASLAGAAAVNYVRAVSLLKSSRRVTGVRLRDEETGAEFEVEARVVINAGGVFSDEIRRLDDPAAAPQLAPSQGAHLVLPARFLPGGHALMIPRTSDGRVLFAIPWLGRVLIGTTDTPVTLIDPEPRAFAEEVGFLLDHVARYLSPAPTIADVVSTYAGLRPLVRTSATRSSAQLSRDHTIEVSAAGLVTITGGKWTTYREMAEDTVTAAAARAGLPQQPCRTTEVLLPDPHGDEHAAKGEAPLHPALAISGADVRRGARQEMARSVGDILARRTRALILDAKASIEVAPAVGRLLGMELGWTADRERQSVAEFQALARQNLPGGSPKPSAVATE